MLICSLSSLKCLGSSSSSCFRTGSVAELAGPTPPCAFRPARALWSEEPAVETQDLLIISCQLAAHAFYIRIQPELFLKVCTQITKEDQRD